MKMYIVDDDDGMVRVLTKLVEQCDCGDVVGNAGDGEAALREIIMGDADIVLVDMLMPKLDGVSLVREVRRIKPHVSFVMVSQVVDSEMITSAYDAGIDFYISKPVNKKELETVLRNISEKLSMKRMLGDIGEIFKQKSALIERKLDIAKDVQRIMSTVGMLGESGTKDIANLINYLIKREVNFSETEFEKYCNTVGEKPVIVRQRIRRAIRKGLSSMALMGIEDYNGEYFQNYANVLFDYDAIKAEMDYLKGRRDSGGKVNVDRFIEGLMLHMLYTYGKL